MNLLYLLPILLSSLLFPVSASAQCPICIVTVGGGMLIAKRLGVDDFLVSIWISALNTAIAFYLAGKFQNDKMMFKKILSNPWLLSVILLAFTLVYFVTTGQTGHLTNKLLGLDKIIFGQVLGMFVMFAGNFIYGYTKYKNNGKALFPYSKVVFPVGLVLLTTIIFKLSFRL
jgi:hypothetical protein